MIKLISFFIINYVFISSSLKVSINTKNVNNLHNINRKTILDLGNTFRNTTYYPESDVTIVKKLGNSSIKLEPIIVLPGLDMSGLSVYTNVIRASENRDAYIILAGYAKTQTLQELCGCVSNYIISKNLKEIVIIGESFGGLMALFLASKVRKRVSHIVFLNPATSYHRTSWGSIVNKKFSNHNIAHRVLGHGPNMEHIMRSIYHVSETYPDHVYFYIMSYFMMLFNILVTDQNLVKRRINSYMAITQPEIDSLCKSLNTKTTIVVGKRDKLLPSSKEADILNNLIKYSRVIKISKAGHLFVASDFDIRDVLY